MLVKCQHKKCIYNNLIFCSTWYITSHNPLCFAFQRHKKVKCNRSHPVFCYTWLQLCLLTLIIKFHFIICIVEVVVLIIRIDSKIIIYIVVTICFFSYETSNSLRSSGKHFSLHLTFPFKSHPCSTGSSSNIKHLDSRNIFVT